MEVLMLNSKRYQPQFDSLEGKVLLSASMANSAATKHHDKVKPFVMTGSLSGLPNGSPGVAGYTATSFPVSGHLASMGTVHGSFGLAHSFVPIGKLPDLAGASLSLENSKGTVQLAIAQTKKNHYKFTVDSGTGKYTSASGSGTMKIASTHAAIDLVISLHSTAVKKA
jgi:hypothetical protein